MTTAQLVLAVERVGGAMIIRGSPSRLGGWLPQFPGVPGLVLVSSRRTLAVDEIHRRPSMQNTTWLLSAVVLLTLRDPLCCLLSLRAGGRPNPITWVISTCSTTSRRTVVLAEETSDSSCDGDAVWTPHLLDPPMLGLGRSQPPTRDGGWPRPRDTPEPTQYRLAALLMRPLQRCVCPDRRRHQAP